MSDSLTLAPATPARWADVIDVFGTRGDPSWCWCHFHSTTQDTSTQSAEEHRAMLQEQVRRRPAPGVLAYRDDQPVGWVRLGPVNRFARVTHSPRRAAVVDDVNGLWVVTCFVVPPGQRRQGVATALLDGAIDFARRHHAAVLEGQPVDTNGDKASCADLYQGVLSTFLAAGFVEVARISPKRPIVWLTLT